MGRLGQARRGQVGAPRGPRRLRGWFSRQCGHHLGRHRARPRPHRDSHSHRHSSHRPGYPDLHRYGPLASGCPAAQLCYFHRPAIDRQRPHLLGGTDCIFRISCRLRYRGDSAAHRLGRRSVPWRPCSTYKGGAGTSRGATAAEDRGVAALARCHSWPRNPDSGAQTRGQRTARPLRPSDPLRKPGRQARPGPSTEHEDSTWISNSP